MTRPVQIDVDFSDLRTLSLKKREDNFMKREESIGILTRQCLPTLNLS